MPQLETSLCSCEGAKQSWCTARCRFTSQQGGISEALLGLQVLWLEKLEFCHSWHVHFRVPQPLTFIWCCGLSCFRVPKALREKSSSFALISGFRGRMAQNPSDAMGKQALTRPGPARQRSEAK